MRYRIRLEETTDSTGSYVVDETDLRAVVAGGSNDLLAGAAGRLRAALAAALPRPRLQVRPGDVLRRKSDGTRWFAIHEKTTLLYDPTAAKLSIVVGNGLDPDKWECILPAES